MNKPSHGLDIQQNMLRNNIEIPTSLGLRSRPSFRRRFKQARFGQEINAAAACLYRRTRLCFTLNKSAYQQHSYKNVNVSCSADSSTLNDTSVVGGQEKIDVKSERWV